MWPATACHNAYDISHKQKWMYDRKTVYTGNDIADGRRNPTML